MRLISVLQAPTGGLAREDALHSTSTVESELRRLLIHLALSIVVIDVIWAPMANFHVAYGAYLYLAMLSLSLFVASTFYERVRPDRNLSAMLFGAGFMCLFSAAASVLNYCLLTVAGPRIDGQLAAIDRALGFDWPTVMTSVAAYPLFNMVLLGVYATMLPQVALLIVALGLNGGSTRIYRYCVAMSVGALVCIAVWSVAPSFGAIAVYSIPAAASHMPLALDQNYAQILISLLAHGPGEISPEAVKGLIGFPSYHAVLAVLTIYYAWTIRLLRWPVMAVNFLMLVATPIQGGHHLVDVLAGFAVAALSLWVAGEWRAASRG